MDDVTQYRLVALERMDGSIKYVVEKKDTFNADWGSIFRSEDIDTAREVLQKNRDRQFKSVRVLDE